MIQVVPPRIWFPVMQIVWGVLTFWYGASLGRLRQAILMDFISTSATRTVQQVSLALGLGLSNEASKCVSCLDMGHQIPARNRGVFHLRRNTLCVRIVSHVVISF